MNAEPARHRTFHSNAPHREIVQAQLIFICSLKWDRKSFYFSCHFKMCSNYFLFIFPSSHQLGSGRFIRAPVSIHGIEITKRELTIKEPGTRRTECSEEKKNVTINEFAADVRVGVMADWFLSFLFQRKRRTRWIQTYIRQLGPAVLMYSRLFCFHADTLC